MDIDEEVSPEGVFDDGEVVVPISALEHYSYCPRQCALIHIEQTFEENIFTIRGRLAHEHIEANDRIVARAAKVLRTVPLWSERLRLWGKADVVEIRRTGPYPVEYKVGARRGKHADLQLCAQALCLEEMLGTPVPKGAVFYHAVRRRQEIDINDDLRCETIRAIAAIRRMLAFQRLPPAPNDARCPNCSLINACLPSVVAEGPRLRGLQGSLFVPYEEETGDE